MNFIKLTQENKPDGIVLGFNEKWVHEDFNPSGVRTCHWCDLQGWVSAYWNNYHECYDTRISIEDNDQYFLSLGIDNIPTHYCLLVKPNIKQRINNEEGD